MHKKHITELITISFIITNVVAYLDEGIRTFEYLKPPGDWIALLVYTILFLLIPFLFFFINKRKLKTRFMASLLGFTPVFLLILLQLK